MKHEYKHYISLLDVMFTVLISVTDISTLNDHDHD